MVMSRRDGTCVVTGGLGFIGRNVTRKLLAEGCRVRVIDRSSRPPIEGAEVTRADVLDGAVLDRALEGAGTVFHLAASAVPAHAEAQPRMEFDSAVRTGIAVMERIQDLRDVRFVLVSSGGLVYGEPERLPIDESHPTRPVSVQGAAKLAIESFARALAASRGLDCVILRVANAYGEGQNTTRPQGVVGLFLDALMAGTPVTLYGDGLQVRDFVHVDDVAEAIVKAGCAELGPGARTMNVGTGKGVSVRDVLGILERKCGRQAAVRGLPARPYDASANVLDSSLARKAMAWSPTVAFEQGIDAMLLARAGRRR